jgi:antitoxin HicB
VVSFNPTHVRFGSTDLRENSTGREILATHEYRCTVLFEPAEEGGYVVTCPALLGLVTEGDTLEEARAMAADAIRGYLESLAKDRLPFPPELPQPPSRVLRETVAVAVETA